MKRVSKYLLSLFFMILSCFIMYRASASSANVLAARTSDKLLGNFIGSAYNIFYGRDADYDGFSYWYRMIGSGQVSVSTFIEKFVLESKEFRESVKIKEDFIQKMYRFIFDRDPDEEGLNYWNGYIDNKIVEYYSKEYPNSYTSSEILILRWNINDSPKVIREVVEKMIHSDEFSVRVSLMNVKLDKESLNIRRDRANPLEIFNSLDKVMYKSDFSKEIMKVSQMADQLQLDINNRSTSMRLRNKIIKYLGANINNVAVSFYDLTTNESFDINGDVLFKAGSTYKVPLNLVLYDLVQAGKIDLNEKVEYVHSKHYEGGSGVLKDYVVDETLPSQTFGELSRRSLLNSDNIAANMLITGISKYANIYGEYGKILGYPLNRTGNLFSTDDMMIFLKKLYYNKDKNPYYKNIITNLKNSSIGVRIGRYIPDNIVANKYGSFNGNYHDIGIVFGDKPFIICIYTNNVNNAEKVIADIAKFAYER